MLAIPSAWNVLSPDIYIVTSLKCAQMSPPLTTLFETAIPPCHALLFHFSTILTYYVIHLLCLLSFSCLFLLKKNVPQSHDICLLCSLCILSSPNRAWPTVGNQEILVELIKLLWACSLCGLFIAKANPTMLKKHGGERKNRKSPQETQGLG